jgi:hypothetical protein
MPQNASVFCNFYIRVDRDALVSERALDVGRVAFEAMSAKNMFKCFDVFTKWKNSNGKTRYCFFSSKINIMKNNSVTLTFKVACSARTRFD